jgi:hypothetical protein
MLEIVEREARLIVEGAGARYDGVMEIPGYRLILFTSMRSGSTLALKFADLMRGGQAGVREHLRESDAKFGHFS